MAIGPIRSDRAEMVLLAVLSGLMVWVIWPYAGAVFWSIVLAVMLDPLWLWIQRNIKAPRGVQALIAVFAVLLLIFIPILIIASLIPSQIEMISRELPHMRAELTNGLASIESRLPPSLAAKAREMLGGSGGNEAGVQVASIVNSLVSWISSFALSTFTLFIMFTITLYVLFFFFLDGRAMFAKVRSYLPFDRALTDMLSVRFIEIVKSTVGGVFMIAIAQGAVCGFILYLLGVGPALLLGVLTVIVSLIPAIGSGLVWIPVAIYFLVSGDVGKAIILVLCGLFVIGMVDNLLRPRLVGRSARIPDFLILLTTLGGLSLMGAVGIVLGPMIAGLCLSMWQTIRTTPEQTTNGDEIPD